MTIYIIAFQANGKLYTLQSSEAMSSETKSALFEIVTCPNINHVSLWDAILKYAKKHNAAPIVDIIRDGDLTTCIKNRVEQIKEVNQIENQEERSDEDIHFDFYDLRQRSEDSLKHSLKLKDDSRLTFTHYSFSELQSRIPPKPQRNGYTFNFFHNSNIQKTNPTPNYPFLILSKERLNNITLKHLMYAAGLIAAAGIAVSLFLTGMIPTDSGAGALQATAVLMGSFAASVTAISLVSYELLKLRPESPFVESTLIAKEKADCTPLPPIVAGP